MEIIKTLVIVLQVLSAVGVVGLVLVQQGKGADAGAAFGSGASGTVFGSVGSANFLSRTTAWLATVFVICTIVLAFIVSSKPHLAGGVDVSGVKVGEVPAQTAPAKDNPAGATTAPIKPNENSGIPK